MIVVDSSAVVDALAAGPRTEELVDALSDEDLHVPHLIDHEVVAAVRGLVLGRHLTVERAQHVLADFEDLPLERWPADAALRGRAFELRVNLSACDAAYVTLAEALDCPLVTRDRKLAGSTGHGARVLVL